MKNVKLLACASALAATTLAPISAEARHHRAHDIRSSHANTASVAIAMRYLGSGNPTGTRGPWCADFVAFVERQAGHQGIASRVAPDWAHYGRPSGPVVGAIAVFRNHVGHVVERVGDQVKVISGNYSHRVGIGMYAIRSAIAFRMP